MKNFLILHIGFEPPSPEEWASWEQWFKSIADIQVDRGGLRDGREITISGINDLPFGKDSFTGYTIIKANSLDDAKNIAARCPIVASTQVYEIHK